MLVMTDEHPELTGYEPGDGRPLRSPVFMRIVRVFVVIGIIALIVPGVVTTVTVGSATAATACAAWVAYLKPDAAGSSARFEMFGPGGPGWQCYTVGAFGGDRLVASLGMIPNGVGFPGRDVIGS